MERLESTWLNKLPSSLRWIGVFIGIGLGFLVSYFGDYAPYPTLALGLVLLFVLLVKHPRFALVLLLLSLFSLDWLSIQLGLLPRSVTWLQELILVALLVRTIWMMSRRGTMRRASVGWILVALLLIGVLATTLQSNSAITMLLGFRLFFKYSALFFILINLDFNLDFLKGLLDLLLVLVFMQIPIAFLQWLGGGNVDNFSGTLGQGTTGFLGVLITFTFCIAFGFATHDKRRRWLLPATALLFIPIVLASIKAVFFLVPVALLFTARRRILQAPRLTLSLLAVIAILYIGVVIVAPTDPSYTTESVVNYLISPTEIVQREFRMASSGRLNRLSGILATVDLMSERAWGGGIGLGPGAATKSYFEEYSGVLADVVDERGLDRTEISVTLIEFGPIGLALFLLLYYRLFKKNARLYSSLAPGYWKAVSLAYDGIVFTYVLSSVYAQVWTADVLTFTFWFMSALVVILCRQSGHAQLIANPA